MRSGLVWIAAAVVLGASTAGGAASELLFFQFNDGRSTYGPSQLWPATGVDSEIAADFELLADIDRVVAGGFIFGTAPEWQGVYVRFYEYLSAGTPGALQREYFLAAGDANLTVSAFGLVDARLSQPFAAQGRHFSSVQPVVNYWYWWSANTNASHGQSFYFRDRAAGTTSSSDCGMGNSYDVPPDASGSERPHSAQRDPEGRGFLAAPCAGARSSR